MDKKKILIIVGVVAVIGIGYYMYNKSKKSINSQWSKVNKAWRKANLLPHLNILRCPVNLEVWWEVEASIVYWCEIC